MLRDARLDAICCFSIPQEHLRLLSGERAGSERGPTHLPALPPHHTPRQIRGPKANTPIRGRTKGRTYQKMAVASAPFMIAAILGSLDLISRLHILPNVLPISYNTALLPNVLLHWLTYCLTYCAHPKVQPPCLTYCPYPTMLPHCLTYCSIG